MYLTKDERFLLEIEAQQPKKNAIRGEFNIGNKLKQTHSSEIALRMYFINGYYHHLQKEEDLRGDPPKHLRLIMELNKRYLKLCEKNNFKPGGDKFLNDIDLLTGAIKNHKHKEKIESEKDAIAQAFLSKMKPFNWF